MNQNQNTGGAAFPLCRAKNMTLRDYFAGQALVGITSVLAKGIRPSDVPKLATDCYRIADAMLKAREERT